jgi:hypothetical protein
LTADGAKVGLLAGLFSAVLTLVFSKILNSLIGQPDTAMLLERLQGWMEQRPGIPRSG